MNDPLMKCGHAANATDGEGNPVCVICVMITPGATIVDDSPPDLSERRARCAYYGKMPSGRNHSSNHGCKRGEKCNCEEPSTLTGRLAYFEHKPDAEYDEFYCGCWGWE